jgi:hypothetical protein
MNPYWDLVISMGGSRNFILHCLFPRNDEICEGYKLSRPDSFVTIDKKGVSIGTNGEQNLVVDTSLV